MEERKTKGACCPYSGKPFNPWWECCKDCLTEPEWCTGRPWKWPLRWMAADRKTAERLGIEKPWIHANPISMIMEFLWREGLIQDKMNWEELLPEEVRTLTHVFRQPKKSGQTREERPLILVVIDYQKMRHWIWRHTLQTISESLCKKYVQALDQAGVIQWTRCYTTSPRYGGRKIYALGTWAGQQEYRHREPFISRSEYWLRVLRTFSLQPLKT